MHDRAVHANATTANKHTLQRQRNSASYLHLARAVTDRCGNTRTRSSTVSYTTKGVSARASTKDSALTIVRR